MMQQQLSEAMSDLERALKIREKANGPENAEAGAILVVLMQVYQAMGLDAEALEARTRAQQIAANIQGGGIGGGGGN
jgi:hypothetical protein